MQPDISEFGTFLKINIFREQIIFSVNFFYPDYGYRLNFFNFCCYRLNFCPFYASFQLGLVSPIYVSFNRVNRVQRAATALNTRSEYACMLQSSPKIHETPMHVPFPLQCWHVIAKLRGYSNIAKGMGKTKGSRILQSVSRFLSKIVAPVSC